MLQARQSARETTSWGALSRVADPAFVPIDSNGNLATKADGTDTWVYSWNARNELTRVLKNGVEQARFAYDPVGRRVEKVAGGLTTGYTYDDEDILREVGGTTARKYVHGQGVDEPLAVDDGTSLSYFHIDGLGSVVKTTNAAGEVAVTRQYDAWGNPQMGVGQPGYAFTGREWDPETGLYYYRARYYDPKVGRFIGEDPIGLRGGIDFYAYVDNDPVNSIDPYGLMKVCCRPIKFFPGCHCWIILQSGETMGAYRDSGLTLTKQRNHRDDKGPPAGSTCWDVPNGDQCQAKAEEAYDKQPPESTYNVFPPTNTSNTPVSRALAVIPYYLPDCAYGRKGGPSTPSPSPAPPPPPSP